MRAPEADTPAGRAESQTGSTNSEAGHTESQVRPRLLIRGDSERATTTTEVPTVAAPAVARETVFDIRDLSVFYGDALRHLPP